MVPLGTVPTAAVTSSPCRAGASSACAPGSCPVPKDAAALRESPLLHISPLQNPPDEKNTPE